MNLLLDLHILLWMVNNPRRLSPSIVAALEEPANGLYLSIVSVWELQIKVGTGKLKLPTSVPDFVTINRNVYQLHPLSITEPHIWSLGTLAAHHRDPFDRLLIAQAITEDWTLVSVDTIFARYPVQLLK